MIVAVQHIQGANAVKHQPAALGQGLQENMALGIVAQGLKMPHALHRCGNGLFVENALVVQLNVQPEPLGHQTAENFQLHLAHDLHMNLPLLPQQMELGVLLLQLPQLGQHLGRVRPLGQIHPIGHYRLHGGGQPRLFCPQGLADEAALQARDSGQGSGGNFLRGGKLVPGIQPQLLHLFLGLLALGIGKHQGLPHPHTAAGDLQPGQPCPGFVPGDFIHPGGKVAAVFRRRGQLVHQCQQRLHPLQLQGGAEAQGEQLPGPNQAAQIPPGDGAGFQIGFQQGLVTQGGIFHNFRFRCGEIHHAAAKLGAQLLQQLLPLGPGEVHFVQEQEGGHPIAFQQPPEGKGVGLNAVGAADNQHGAVQHRHGALGLGGKIHMPRRVHQGNGPMGRFQPGLL